MGGWGNTIRQVKEREEKRNERRVYILFVALLLMRVCDEEGEEWRER
jgi:hypothetical protein